MNLGPIILVVYIAGYALFNSLLSNSSFHGLYNLVWIGGLMCRKRMTKWIFDDLERAVDCIRTKKNSFGLLIILSGISRLLWHKIRSEGDSISFSWFVFFKDAILPALLEEPLSRGVVFFCLVGSLKNRPLLLAMLMILIDASLHNPSSIGRLLVVVNFAAIQTSVWLRSKSLWLCISFHIFWNSIIFLPAFS